MRLIAESKVVINVTSPGIGSSPHNTGSALRTYRKSCSSGIIKNDLLSVCVCSLFLPSQELKQDISSFRYEVMGMMKTGKPALPVAKAGCSSMDFSLAYPSVSLKVSSCPQSSQVKSKLNRFKIVGSILKQCCSASPRPPEAFNGLPNGLLALTAEESSYEKASQRKNFPKDITDFGLFHKRLRSGIEVTAASGETSRKIYSLSEEAGESGNSDTEEMNTELTADNTGSRPLLEEGQEEETAAKEAQVQNCDTEDTEEKIQTTIM